MRRRFTHMLFCLFFSGIFFAQPHLIKKPKAKSKSSTTNFALGVGLTRSVLYLSRNIKQNNDATGYNATLIYGGKKIFRLSLEYTYFKPINIEPTWSNITAHTLEANAHLIARFKKTDAYFYPLVGLSYNVFRGYFTGLNDFLNLSIIYPKNSVVQTKWLGLNIGTGYEYYFKPGSFFLDYKMRIGVNEGNKQLTILDVCFAAGLRFNMRAPSIYRLFKGTRSRYLLDTREQED